MGMKLMIKDGLGGLRCLIAVAFAEACDSWERASLRAVDNAGAHHYIKTSESADYVLRALAENNYCIIKGEILT